MKKDLFLILICCFLMFFSTCIASACSLPAEPSAAAIPIGDVTRVDAGDGTSYYLTPQGGNVQLQIVWDPATHIQGKVTQRDKYIGVVKAGFTPLPDIPKVDGCGFFNLIEMSEFFGVTGNRQSPAEALSRMTGGSLPPNGFLPSYGLGSYKFLSQFANSPGDILEVTDSQYTTYPSVGIVENVMSGETPVSIALDGMLPESNSIWNSDPIECPAGTIIKVAATADPKIKVKIQNCGVYIDDLDLQITKITPEYYKAYEWDDTDAIASKIYMDGVPLGPDGYKDGVPCPPSGKIDVKFPVPTIFGNGTTNLKNSMKKFKVYAPPAGFILTNMYWCWEELKYEQITIPAKTELVYEADGVTPVYEADGVTQKTKTIPAKTEWKQIGLATKCSREMKMTVIKEPKLGGWTGIVVHDNSAPIASKIEINEPANFKLKTSGPSDFEFTMTVLDSNPFAAIPSSIVPGFEITPDATTVAPSLFYSYPYYQYSVESGIGIKKLKDGYGLADFATAESGEEKFKAIKYEPQWVWKKATPTDVKVVDCGPSSLIYESGGRLVGSTFKITGKIKIEVNPWHSCNDPAKSLGTNIPANAFKLFGITKDTTKHENTWFSAINGGTYPKTKELDDGGTDRALIPGGTNEIPANTSDPCFGILSSPEVSKVSWQNQVNFYSIDDVAPEIQIFVLDTRTNKFHVFGSKSDMDAEFTNFGSSSPGYSVFDYTSVSEPFPFYGAKTTNVNLTNIEDASGVLFNKYFTKGVSTVADGTNDGFVCQKNTRLIFYVRAFDNINTFKIGKNYGVKECYYKITDKASAITSGTLDEGFIENKMLEPIDHQFRYENVDSGENYNINVRAKDYSGNSRELTLKIGVRGRTLDIRTLEERRNREN